MHLKAAPLFVTGVLSLALPKPVPVASPELEAALFRRQVQVALLKRGLEDALAKRQISTAGGKYVTIHCSCTYEPRLTKTIASVLTLERSAAASVRMASQASFQALLDLWVQMESQETLVTGFSEATWDPMVFPLICPVSRGR
jgi:hypothetical protein